MHYTFIFLEFNKDKEDQSCSNSFHIIFSKAPKGKDNDGFPY